MGGGGVDSVVGSVVRTQGAAAQTLITAPLNSTVTCSLLKVERTSSARVSGDFSSWTYSDLNVKERASVSKSNPTPIRVGGISRRPASANPTRPGKMLLVCSASIPKSPADIT